jgi:threonine dehydrogenase-like Zn-dependent dehydrogenase
LGEVIDAPDDSGLAPGDLVAGVVRRPDPVPCSACAAGEWDMCRNGGFIEFGIKEHDGYGSERFRIDPRFAIRLDASLGDVGVLLEPTSVVAKAWDHAERIGSRAWFDPKVALITGAGPIGLLAAMLARQRGLETYVADVVTEGEKPRLVADLGAHYHSGPISELDAEPDIVIECTGLGQVAVAAARRTAPGAIVALTGIADSGQVIQATPDAMNRVLVLGNKVAFGSVNAARRHYEQAAVALARADPAWLSHLITRRVSPDEWPGALQKSPDDIKVVVDMTAA